MDDCIFCKIAKGELPAKVVYEDDSVIAFNDIHPQAPVHILVVPKTHILDILEVETEMLTQLVSVAKKLIIERKMSSFRLVTNGLDAQLVKHLHIHILGGVNKERKL